MKKALLIIGGIIVSIVVFVVFIIVLVSSTSKKMVCKSDEGNITIMYSKKTIKGYVASGMTYDLTTQKKYAKQIGIEAYLDEFNDWFETNTSGTCKR